MNNIIPFPKNPAEAREDKEMAMEALIWETMSYDDRTAAAVAQFVYDLKLPIFTDLVKPLPMKTCQQPITRRTPSFQKPR